MKTALFIALSVAATAAGARLSVPLPFGEAPMTLQTLVVCFTALALPFGPALAAMVLYVGLGVAGVPLFAGGAEGLAVLRGTSGGYLIGFIAAVPVAAVFKLIFSGDRTFTQMLFAAVFAHVAILALGATWMHYGLGRTWFMALEGGVWPYTLGAFLKSVVAAGAATWIMRSKD